MSAPLISLNLSKDIPSPSHLIPCLCTHPIQQHSSHYLCHHNSSGITDLYDLAEAIGSMTIDNGDSLEANLVMDLARARRDVFRAEKMLADCVVQEHEILANLSKYQSNILKKMLDRAGLGYMRITFKSMDFLTVDLHYAVCKAYILACYIEHYVAAVPYLEDCLPGITTRDVNDISPLTIGSYVIMQHSQGHYIGQVVCMYKKNGGGKGTQHEGVLFAGTKDTPSLTNLGLQVFIQASGA
ncbi:hypothetical protein BDR07DRAFT_1559438 [Suillus spraguei]|nr:hypothetical protein BDR07DRAFT_1559438 [Suillus spraguei]